eukprot:TRINITY_DN4110_c0_g1_i1.p1 TRINITY_DN4110_c0_g1~~TRINITY_DN4110_c0_g1_i1.p1  ORF type:complete len:378 (-),score=149.21 TRINITY_DN4110_c0_g1_i1:21-1085(-)
MLVSCSLRRSFSFQNKPRLYSTEATALSFQRYGSPDQVLSLGKHKLAEPRENEVQVQLLAAPIHHLDFARIQGTLPLKESLPAVGGLEGVGVVVKVGSKVTGLKPADKVIAVPSTFGTWRTHAVVRENDLIKVDPSLKTEHAAVLSIGLATAHRLLEDFKPLKSGDVVIQNGANGFVAQAIVQLAARKGIRTINIVKDGPNQAETIEKLKTYGAYLVVNEGYVRSIEFRKLIADLPPPSLAFNGSGGRTALEMARVLKDGGTLVTYGGSGRQPLQFPSSLFLAKDLRLRGFSLKKWVTTHSQEDYQELIKTVEQYLLKDQVKVWVEKHKLANFQEALTRAVDPFKDRKIILSME